MLPVSSMLDVCWGSEYASARTRRTPNFLRIISKTDEKYFVFQPVTCSEYGKTMNRKTS